MAVKSPEQTQRVACNVTPHNRACRVYYVEATLHVPHKFLIAVSAPDPAAACRLANQVVRNGKGYGIPDFTEAGALEVSALRSGAPCGTKAADRIEPIPAEHARATRNISA